MFCAVATTTRQPIVISSSARPFAERAKFRALSIRETPWISEYDPPPDQLVSVLACDNGEKYVPPFPCRLEGGTWHNARFGTVLQVRVIGWHPITPVQE